MQCLVSLSDGLMGLPSLSTTPSWHKTTRKFNRACACTGQLDRITLPETEPARARLQIVRAMLNVGWPVLLAALFFLLTTNPSDSIFGDVLGALQTLSRVQTSRDPS
jgi:hypothetical protein